MVFWLICIVGGIGNAWILYDWYKNRANRSEHADATLEPKSERGTGANPFAGITEAELASLLPPSDVHASEPWDRFWQTQVKFGVAGFTDLFVDDRHLIDMMHARGFSTVLCVGAGLSAEPHALAAAGMMVTVLDISPLVAEGLRRASIATDGLDRFVDTSQLRPGGSVGCVVGDLMDPTLCPGPYDLVVERKTLQLFSEGERGAALAAVAARLTPNGMLFTHCHDGAWRPGRDRTHYVEPLLAPAGFTIGNVQSGRWSATGRTAFTFLSTG